MSSKGDKKYNDTMFLQTQKIIFNISKVKIENFVETLGLYLKIFSSNVINISTCRYLFVYEAIKL